MILESLRQLALREGLVDDPAFESKPVRWIVKLERDGAFIGVYDTNTTPLPVEGKKTKPRPEAKMMVIPRRRGRTGNIAADFLVDKAEYALGLVPAGESGNPKTASRLVDFVALLRKAEEATQNPALGSVASFLANAEGLATCADRLEQQGGFATNDLFAFDVDGESLQDHDDLRVWWSELRTPPAESSDAAQCLLCGLIRQPVAKHNDLQLAGAVSSGIALVSFNSDAFEKYGWSGNRNAPICSECMTAYVEGLRRLTKPRYFMPRSEKTVTALSTRLSGDTTAVYWADTDSELVSAIPFMREQPEKVRELVASPQKGSRFQLADRDRFFCLILTGAQGRAIVRRVHTGTVAEVERNLRRFFAAIDVDRFDRSPPMPLFMLLQSLVLQGKLDRLPPNLGTELWLAALFGQPLSRFFLAALIARNRAERAVPAARAALLQFYFASRATHTPPDASSAEPKEPLMSLDPESKNPPYLLGRLLAVLESIQTAAQGRNLNRTIVDRFYGSASTRPGVVFPQLLNLAMHHLSKTGKLNGGKAYRQNQQLEAIMNGLKVGGFSSTLNLEEQGNFALGYYHQRHSSPGTRNPIEPAPEDLPDPDQAHFANAEETPA